MFDKIKSPETLFSKTPKTDIPNSVLNQNILYLTHQIDKCLLVLKELKNSTGLQKQVDEYFEDRQPEEDKEPD